LNFLDALKETSNRVAIIASHVGRDKEKIKITDTTRFNRKGDRK